MNNDINSTINQINEISASLSKEKGTSLAVLPQLDTPKKDPQIVSSSSVIADKTTASATQKAANTLTANSATQTTPQTDPKDKRVGEMSGSELMTFMQQLNKPQTDAATSVANRAFKAQELSFNSALAQKNQKYSQLQDSLQREYEKSSAVAQDNAIALNPYSQSRGATTSANFQQTLTDNFQRSSRELETQANLAEQALEAGNYKGYAEIQDNLDSILAKVTTDSQKTVMDFQRQSTQESQFEKTFGLQSENTYTDNFNTSLSQALPNQTDLMAMTDEQLLALPQVQFGLKAGLTLPQIGNQILAASHKQGLDLDNKASLISTREATVALKEEIANRQQGVIEKVTALISNPSIDKGSTAFYQNIANATAGGKPLGPTQASEFGLADAILTRAGEVRSTLENLEGTDALVNLVNKKNPYSKNVAAYEGAVQSVMSNIARYYGEKGTLSDADITRIAKSVGSVGTPSEVRTKLWNETMKSILGGTNSKILGYASSGFDVSAYGAYIPQLEQLAGKASVGSTSFSVAVPGGKTYNFPDQASLDNFKKKANIK